MKVVAICDDLRLLSVCKHTEVVETEACRRLSRAVVSAAPRARSCVAWVCRSAQFLRQSDVDSFKLASSEAKEPLHDRPKSCLGNPHIVLFQTSEHGLQRL